MARKMIGIHEAKAKFSKFVDRVEAGEAIGLTRRGKPFALLTRVHQNRSSAFQATVRIRELRCGSRLNGLSIKELRDESRR